MSLDSGGGVTSGTSPCRATAVRPMLGFRIHRMGGSTLSLTDLYGPVRGDLAVAERIFDEELASEFPFIDDLCEVLRSYRGKMLRPALLLLTAKAIGPVSMEHRTLAAVVEMVHMSTLVHDDVLDEADERRRRPTIGSMSGNTTAVLLGDYLISHAFHLCSGLDSQYASRRIGATTNTVCAGEMLQNTLRGNAELSEQQYLDIIRRKTGALTAVACELGAKYAGGDRALVEAMHDYGMSAGVAFQIIDDVLDIIGDSLKVGKTLGQDLALGKLTLPTLHCLTATDGPTASAIRSVITGSRPPQPAAVRSWLNATGSIDYAVSVARTWVADAIRRLDSLPNSDARQSLTALAEFILDRQF